MKKLLLLVSVLSVGLLCCGDPYQEKMPADPADKGSLLSLIRYLKDDEQKVLLAYQERIANQKALGGEGYPPGMTVQQALDEQRRWSREEGERMKREREEAIRKLQEEEARKKAEEEKALKQMLEICTVEMVSKKVTKKKSKGDALSFEAFDIDLRFRNKGKKDLTMVIGTLQMLDENGNMLKEMKIPYRRTLKAGQSATFGGKSRYDPSKEKDVALANIPLSKLKTKWIPKVYKFEDGTRIGTEPEPEKLRRR